MHCSGIALPSNQPGVSGKAPEGRMSGTATEDLKPGVMALAKELESLADAAAKEQLSKTALAASNMRGNFLKAMKAEWKGETLTFYKNELPKLHRIEEAERKTVGVGLDKEIKRLEALLEGCIKDAESAGLDKRAKQARDLKGDFERAIKAHKSSDMVESHEEQIDKLVKAVASEGKKAKGEKDEEEEKRPEPVYTINDKKFADAKLKGAEIAKYEEWVALAKQEGGVKAATDLFGKQASKMTDGRWHFRLSGGNRVYFTTLGKAVSVTGPDHENEKK